MYIGLNTAIVGQKNPSLTQIVSSLFSNGEQGAWYDPSDLTTLFQDAAGTTPVTAVEQPVGLMLDKSKGLVLGPESVVNGDFSNGTTGWIADSGCTLAASNGVLTVTTTSDNTFAIQQNNVYQTNKTYQVTFTYRVNNTSTARLRSGATTFWSETGSPTNKTVTVIIFPTTTQFEFGVTGGTVTEFYISNISVRELPGNHAYQTVSTQRPMLSARVNLLTKTEQFDNAAWTKTSTTVTANTVVAPDGTLTGDKVGENTASTDHVLASASASLTSGATYTMSFYLKGDAQNQWAQVGGTNSAFGANAWANFDLINGVVGNKGSAATASIQDVGNGWFRCIVSVAATATTTGGPGVFLLNNENTNVRSPSFTGDGYSGIYIWGASLVPANQSTLPYQRVNTATDYATTGFPYYLLFDGIDDAMQTNSIDFTATDKMSVFAGVRKLSDAASGTLCELSSNLGTNNGTFAIYAPATVTSIKRSHVFVSKGTLSINATPSDNTLAAPITNVITGISNISGDTVTLHINGTQAASTIGDLGTGNFGNYPLYIGRRGGTTLSFNGRLYGLVVRGALSSTAEITSAESYMNTFTRAY